MGVQILIYCLKMVYKKGNLINFNKDLKVSDINRFSNSQNTDGNRKKNEFLTESFFY